MFDNVMVPYQKCTLRGRKKFHHLFICRSQLGTYGGTSTSICAMNNLLTIQRIISIFMKGAHIAKYKRYIRNNSPFLMHLALHLRTSIS